MSYYFPSPPTSPTERKRKRSISNVDTQQQQKQVKLDPTLLERYLITGGSPNIRDTQRGFSLLCWACYSKSESALELLLRQEDLDPTTTHGPDRSTALHIAASVGFSNGIETLLLHIRRHNPSLEQQCLNALDQQGATPLHVAVLANQPQCVEILLKQGKAKINIQDRQGRLPLHIAFLYRRMACAQLLLDALQQEEDMDLLWIPNHVDHRNVIEECIVGGCVTLLKGLIMKINQQQQQQSKKKNKRNINKNNLIRLAVFWNRIECLELLLGATTESWNQDDNDDVGTQQMKPETDPMHHHDHTPLYQAVQQRKLDLVQCLREKANANPCLPNGHNPSLIYAASHGFLDMIPLLLTQDTSSDCIRQAVLLAEPLGLSNTIVHIIKTLRHQQQQHGSSSY
ncbi:ankyrin repeat-containing domain protein [Phascolomyces articulosus]|uniref:Ankyrin repeat-containing domain protein n=1 Tax=Phascolomyces articulosus TaxID=60185 RepID=A0AAD5JX35_9FUNG|nr:ankyrin repeat-containing domain protein [Phascolomyces articulosus]